MPPDQNESQIRSILLFSSPVITPETLVDGADRPPTPGNHRRAPASRAAATAAVREETPSLV